MLESDGKKELTGIARSIDGLFLRMEGAVPEPEVVADSVDQSVPEDSVTETEPFPEESAVPADDPIASSAFAVPDEGGVMLDGWAAAPPPLPEEGIEPAVVAAPEEVPEEAASMVGSVDPAKADPVVEEAAPVVEVVEAVVEEAEPVVGVVEPVIDVMEAESGMAVPPLSTDAAEDGEEVPPTELDLAVEAYLGGDAGRASDIERLGAEMLERRELDPVARAVVRLTVAAGDPPEASVYAVAESIIQPTVLEHVVRRLGGERDDEARQEYYATGRAIGEPMAHALRDGLGDTTTDRLARRNYCDALLAMGEVSRPTIESMALDDNRFLARNAIAMLGDMGGESALELVTAAMGNPDARVRREALRALAKIGDTESGSKIMELGLLKDSDDEVTLAAATTAGELGVLRAISPLIAMLDETKDPDRAIPIMRALGLLGDPGAVPSIEKWAVPSLFSKPPTEARIAAYRALYAIGTPHAMKLLAKASSDKDAAVQSAVMDIKSAGSAKASQSEEDSNEA